MVNKGLHYRVKKLLKDYDYSYDKLNMIFFIIPFKINGISDNLYKHRVREYNKNIQAWWIAKCIADNKIIGWEDLYDRQNRCHMQNWNHHIRHPDFEEKHPWVKKYNDELENL